ncbi:hypothetical protein L873DRAFT_1902052 [Choiromyces venosus 120613-1]|uniref:Uncharacterized protein n=1 Tax=Choiromyces venosus 120613-1 TaxID=1336337 RepID=A0A3N4JTR5_9PEZI|nr:hypothetical protein L873DRAFT_1902052 [Choiromyces venosus 120613-1]
MGNTHSTPSSSHKSSHKHAPHLFNLPLPSAPFRLPHFLPQFLKLSRKTYNTETTIESIKRLKGILAAATIMLNTYSILSPETHPELRAHFVMFKEGAEDFYLNKCERLIEYNAVTGWYDVQHGKVGRGVEAITKEFFWLSRMARELSHKEEALDESSKRARWENKWGRVMCVARQGRKRVRGDGGLYTM